MKTNRLSGYAFLLLCILAGSAMVAAAQDSGGDTSEEPPEKKVGFFGNRFALYIQAGTGSMGVQDVESSLKNDSSFSTINNVSFTDFTYGNAAIGWELPYDRGRFELRYNGYKEDSYHLSSQGLWRSLTADSDIGLGELPQLKWWNLDVQNGFLTSTLFPPSWFADQNDNNGDGLVDADEVTYGATPDVSISRPAQRSMRNNVQVLDLLYRRWFGGRRYGGVWSAGVRYLQYQGSIPAAFWISLQSNEFGWTSGGFQNPLVFSQDTSGLGPTTSLGVRARFFRDRLQFFLEGRIAFIIQTMETDSGSFFTLLPQPGSQGSELLSIPAHIDQTLDKDVWNAGAELGVRVQLLSGLNLELAYKIDSYQDAVLLPTLITIPDVPARIEQGVGGVFRSQDLRYDGVSSTLTFQF